MKPLPETRRAIEEFGPFLDADGDLLELLIRSSHQVLAVVPSCLGLTFAKLSEGLAFTLVADDLDLAALDAVQYVDHGPCVEAVERGVTTTHAADDPTDEDQWALFARASGASGVASTLTLPLMDGNVVHGSVNLYASTIDAFDDHHDEVARIFDAWAPGAITNADLSFDSAQVARRAPQVLADDVVAARATGVLVQRHAVSVEEARDRLLDAAARAGVDAAALARLIVEPPK